MSIIEGSLLTQNTYLDTYTEARYYLPVICIDRTSCLKFHCWTELPYKPVLRVQSTQLLIIDRLTGNNEYILQYYISYIYKYVPFEEI